MYELRSLNKIEYYSLKIGLDLVNVLLVDQLELILLILVQFLPFIEESLQGNDGHLFGEGKSSDEIVNGWLFALHE